MIRALATVAALTLLAACAAPQPPPSERFPVPRDYPPGVMEEGGFVSGAPEGWRLSYLKTGPRAHLGWRIVVVSGTPSWPAYWAPTIAALPDDVEMIVVARPGFSTSEPQEAVPSLRRQADAIAPLLDAPDGRPVLLVGQSFGAPIAAIMAGAHPGRVKGLVLVSSYFGVRGATANRLFGVGRLVRWALPRDFRNSVTEVSAQPAQLPEAWTALESLRVPITFIHGDRDTFVPIASAEQAAQRVHALFVTAPGGDHFLNACCVPALIGAFEGTMARSDAANAAPAPG